MSVTRCLNTLKELYRDRPERELTVENVRLRPTSLRRFSFIMIWLNQMLEVEGILKGLLLVGG